MNHLKSTELRAGNLVKAMGMPSGENIIFPIAASFISTLTQYEAAGKNISDRWVRLRITEDILPRLGLKASSNYAHDWKVFSFPDPLYMLQFNETGTITVEFGMDSIVEVKYVHDLQNLYFALTRTELTLSHELRTGI